MSRVKELSYTIKKYCEGDPKISVVVVDSRSKLAPAMLEKCLDSLDEQSFKDFELVLIDNTDRFHTIGKCYNLGADVASSEWVYYLGDDDYITPDYLHSLMVFLEIDDVVEILDGAYAVSTYLTMFDSSKDEQALKASQPMGLFNRAYTVKNRFNETLSKYVDVDFGERAIADGKNMITCPWHFGYYYRQHSDNVSGRKRIESEKE